MGESGSIKLSCGIYLFNNRNKMLIGHPTGFKPNVWAIPKGRVDIGETDHFNVAKRELLEETGINLDEYNIIKFKEFDIIRYRETNKYLKGFFVKVDSDMSDVDLKCDSMVYRNGSPAFPEFDDFRWVTVDESRELLHSFQFSNLDMCSDILLEKLKYIVEYKTFKL